MSSLPRPRDQIQPGHLLAAFMGSERAAEDWRRQCDREERWRLSAAVARDLAAERERSAGETASLWQEIRAQAADAAAEAARLVMADELPAAVEYLTMQRGAIRNGQVAGR
jgi:hypothetical protein